MDRRTFLGTSTLALSAMTAGLALPGCTPGKTATAVPFRISLNSSTIRTYKLPVEQQVDLCGAAGFDGIELWMSDIADYRDRGGSLPQLARRIKDSGLVLENMIGFAQWAADDESRRNEGQQQMQREMEITAALGGKFIAAPVMGIDRLDSGRFDEYAQRYLHIIESGKTIGVTPLLEVWGSGTLSRLADAAHIAIATAHADANLLLDFYHLYRGGNSFDSLNLINVAKLPVFHINDYPAASPRSQLSDSDRVYPGDGICPFNILIPALQKNGFRGAFSIELFNEEYCRQNTVEQVLTTALEKTRKTIML